MKTWADPQSCFWPRWLPTAEDLFGSVFETLRKDKKYSGEERLWLNMPTKHSVKTAVN